MDSDPYCLFSGRIEKQSGDYVVRVPVSELDLGSLETDELYRVGVYPAVETSDDSAPAVDSATAERTSSRSEAAGDESNDGPPVTEGEVLELEVEDVGDQGDGLARVGPGYVVFVPDAEVGDRPTVRITTVRENFAFAERVA